MKKLLLLTVFILAFGHYSFSQLKYEQKRFKILAFKEINEKYSSAQIVIALDVMTGDTCDILTLPDTLKSHADYVPLVLTSEYDFFVTDIFKNMPASPTPMFIRLGPNSYVDPSKLRPRSYFAKGLIGKYFQK